jgi:hypothetical protein
MEIYYCHARDSRFWRGLRFHKFPGGRRTARFDPLG